jgi:hypothetical protein
MNKYRLRNYLITTKSGHQFTITAYSNFHAATKAQSIGGSGITIEEIKNG